MILNDFVIQSPAGLYCPYGDFYLDPQQAVERAVVSHAHFDHICKGIQTIYANENTIALATLRMGKRSFGQTISVPYHQKFSIKEVEIELLPAGHILGSAQILMTYRGIRYLYTGDFKLQNDATCEAFEFTPTDVLITETTFANPDAIHPEPEEEIKKLSSINQVVILGAYALGKAQRLVALINQYCPEKLVAVHFSIAPINKIYEQQGITLGEHILYNRKLVKSNFDNLVYIVPPTTLRSYARTRNGLCIFATGWHYNRDSNNLSLQISDHADWNDLLSVITNSRCREVWTTHGDGSLLKKYLEGTIDVKPLNV